MDVNVTLTTLAVFVVIFIIFLIGLLVYLYPASGKRSSIPGPNPSDVKEGNVSDIRKAGSLQQYLYELHDEFGKVIGFWHGDEQIVSVSSFEHFAPRSQIFEVPAVLFDGWRPLVGDSSFLFSQGVDVFSRREKLDFSVDVKAKQYYGAIFSDIAKEIVNKWASMPEGQHVPLTQHLRGLSTKVVCRMLFGDVFKDDSKVFKLHKAWEHCWTYIESVALEEDSVNLEDDFKRNLKILKRIVEEALDDRFKKQGKNNPVILDGILSSKTPASESQLLSDALTQLTIGMHVTYSVLLWTMYFVATHSEVQDKLRKEISKTNDPSIMPESLAKIKYVQCILKESIRCGSIFSWCGRKQDIDNTIGGHLVAKNTPVIEAIGVAMMDEDLFDDPTLFDPDRFANEETLNPMDYIPFAFGGNRKASNESLVYLMSSILACNVVRKLKIAIAGDTDVVDPDYTSFVSKPSKEELWAVVCPAKDVEVIGKKD